jgi:Zn-dependent peptidase ImmA (M78 family)
MRKRTPYERRMEAEANAFAMELLMPADWVRREAAKLGGVDIEDEKKVAKLAKKFGVSNAVMTLRLGQLLAEQL